MNYFPNYYSNQYTPQMQMPNYTNPMMQQSQPMQGLNGKMVDSIEVVKATEVPMGGYAIFPKADLSEIYIKSWNNNGTTSIITFVPNEPISAQPRETVANNGNELVSELLAKINEINAKIDGINVAGGKINNEY